MTLAFWFQCLSRFDNFLNFEIREQNMKQKTTDSLTAARQAGILQGAVAKGS